MMARLRNYLIAGVLTVVPVWITWIVFRFILGQLSNMGTPWVEPLARLVAPYSPRVATAMLQPWFHEATAVVLTLLGLVVLGWLATRVVGGRLISAFDRLINTIPLVKKIYGSSKALISVLEQKPGQVQRVVLINFPSGDMKTVGFVTRVLTDRATGREVAAVYVPTTPNPTSGYLEIVPVEYLVSTDWSVDQAMTFVISGGTVSPETIQYHEDPATGDTLSSRGPLADTPGRGE